MGMLARRLSLGVRRWQRRNTRPLLDRYGDACGVLEDQDQARDAVAALKAAKLAPHPDFPKNWDAAHALASVLRHTTKDARVMDAGSGLYGPILQWLALLGYRNLEGCDISFDRDFRVGPIRYRRVSLLETGIPSATLDAVTCLSVIEHGVDVRLYAKEMARVLKPGGVLVTSTDYWPDPIDTRGVYPYGKEMGEMKIFDRGRLKGFVDALRANGLKTTSPMAYGAKDRVVNWARTGKRFTFALVTATRS